jgi:hypothetical protein
MSSKFVLSVIVTVNGTKHIHDLAILKSRANCMVYLEEIIKDMGKKYIGCNLIWVNTVTNNFELQEHGGFYTTKLLETYGYAYILETNL